MEHYFVYIIFSKVFGKYYTGQTFDLENRLSLHNSARVKSTKSAIPWELIHFEKLENRSEAMILELKIKKPGAKRYLLDISN